MMMATKSLFVVLAVVTLAVLQLEHAKAGIRDWDCDQVQQWVETVGLGKVCFVHACCIHIVCCPDTPHVDADCPVCCNTTSQRH